MVLLAASICFIIVGLGALWVSTLKMPDLNTFETRVISQSTKIYDRTGEMILYDVNTDTKRTVVPLSEISPLIQNATIAIEDANFYSNIGIEPLSIIRAVIANITSTSFGQGGSTITQQVVKNALLTKDKTITRKIKEWILAVKLTKMVSKEKILETYLNESPYGGTIYGIEEASQSYFGKPASEVTLAEAAFLAAIPQAPTYYSPYGIHQDELKVRQELVLKRMLDLGMIAQQDFDQAKVVDIKFLSKNSSGIRAPHFVMMVKDYLAQKYGEDVINNSGLKVITTLDFDMQNKMEDSVARFAKSLSENFNASNTAMVAIDPQTGDVLALMGSKDYFDDSIAGNYNVALGLRQPGSTFKPFVYATAFEKGYTPDTVLFDVKTEFSAYCDPEGKPLNPNDDPEKVCYSPNNYDEKFEGPIKIKNALADSRNIPAVKTLYLAGLVDSLKTATNMGITTLKDPNRYGLTLVLGGGEVKLIDLVSAYGVFANDGVRNPYRIVLSVEDADGNVLEKSSTNPTRAIESEVTRQITGILSDRSIRMSSLRPVADSIGRPVAIKTGTTNDYRDVWTVGYTPNLVVGAWAGNSDNTPMQKNVAGLIITPLWGAFMSQAVVDLPEESFLDPKPVNAKIKPTLRGIWQGGVSYWKDTISGKVATEYTPPELQEEVIFPSVHSILNWVNKDDPLGAIPSTPQNDPQYKNWEYGVREWFTNYQKINPSFVETASSEIPKDVDDVHHPDKYPVVRIASPTEGSVVDPSKPVLVKIDFNGKYPYQKSEIYLNGKLITSSANFTEFSFVPNDIGGLSENINSLSVISYDKVLNKGQAIVNFNISK